MVYLDVNQVSGGVFNEVAIGCLCRKTRFPVCDCLIRNLLSRDRTSKSLENKIKNCSLTVRA